MKRKKYTPKNPGEFKIMRKCHRIDCKEPGVVTYRKGIAGTQHSCIDHVHKSSQPPKVKHYTDVASLLSLANYHARG